MSDEGMKADRGQSYVSLDFLNEAGRITGSTRVHGSRLDPGELQEIELAAAAGEVTRPDQVLGMVETVYALTRRLATRFQETVQLREQLRECEAAQEIKESGFHDGGFVSLTPEAHRELTNQRDAAVREVENLKVLLEQASAPALENTVKQFKSELRICDEKLSKVSELAWSGREAEPILEDLRNVLRF